MQKSSRSKFPCSLLLALLLGAASVPAKEKSLYRRLGETKAIAAVVDEFITPVSADSRINRFFARTDLPNVKEYLVNQICEAAGGPCKYLGRDMKGTHKGMGISGADFDALVEDLVHALDKFKVGEKEKNALLAVFAPMKSDIVEKH
jgi:hemoglobin